MCSVRLGRRRVKEITQTQDLWHPPDKNLNSENTVFFSLPCVSELSRPYRSCSHDGLRIRFLLWLRRPLKEPPKSNTRGWSEATERGLLKKRSFVHFTGPTDARRSLAAADDNNRTEKVKNKKRFCRGENSFCGFLPWFHKVSMGMCRQLPSLHLHAAI